MNDLLTKINVEIEKFRSEAAKAAAGNKAAGTRSRQTSLRLAALLKDWRAESVKAKHA